MLNCRRAGICWGCITGLCCCLLSPVAYSQIPMPFENLAPVEAEATPAAVQPQPAALRAAEFSRLRKVAAPTGSVRVLVQVRVPQYEQLRAESVRAKRRDLAARTDGRLSQAIQTAAQAELALLAGTPHRIHRTYSSIPYVAMTVSPRALEVLEKSPNVLGIEEDKLARPMLDNTVNIVGATNAWAQGFDGSGWYVAILDTGIRDTHNAFAGKDIVQACFASGTDGNEIVGDCPNGAESDTTSPNAAEHYSSNYNGWDHGTHVAGIAAGNDAGPPRFGVARGADLIAIQVFSKFTDSDACNPPGADCLFTNGSDYIAALDYVYGLRTTYNIASANMSLGGGSYADQGTCDLLNSSAKSVIDNLRGAGIATVVASGNDNACFSMAAPGCISSAVAVGAVTDDDVEAGFSNFHETMLDLYAPGVDVESARAGADDHYDSFSGTSMATPHVAGTWAILRQAAPDESVGFLLSLLQDNGDPISGTCGIPVPEQRRIQIDAVTELIGPLVRPCDLSGEVTAGDPDAGAEFGYAVDLFGSASIVGARREDCLPSTECGAAYLYRWDGANWNPDGKLVASDAAMTDRFGSAVAIDGDRVIVGSPTANLAMLADAGAAYAYTYDGMVWGNEAKLVASDGAAGDQFGYAIAIDGDLAVISAVNADGHGAAYVFRHDGLSWGEEDKLVPGTAAAGDAIGQSVAIDGDVIVVGGMNVNCVAGADCGAAWVFRWDGLNWVEEQKLTAPDAFTGDWFGFAAGVSGNSILISSPVDNCTAGTVCGSIHPFTWDGATWNHGGKIVPYDQDAGDFFGGSLVVDGTTALAGGSSNDCIGLNNCGSAYVLLQDGGVWDVDAKFNPPVAEASASFGHAVGLDGSLAVISSRLRDANSLSNSGAAYMYAAALDCNGNSVSDTCDILDGFSLDDDLDGEPDECCPPSSTPIAEASGIRVRYLSIIAGDPGRQQAIRVTLTNLPGAFAAFNGRSMFVGPPQTVCENAGQVTPPGGICGPAPGAPAPSMQAATLQCNPHYRDWSAEGTVHVSHALLVPDGDYELQVVDASCLLALEEDYSAPLVLDTSRWGDAVSNCASLPCGAPNNIVEISDVLAILDKFRNIVSGPVKSRGDIEPATPDRIVSISDVTQALNAFSGNSYAFAAPGSFPCP